MYDLIANILQQQFSTSHNINGAKPSSHAVAVWRAAHQLIEQPPIFNDPVALQILGHTKTDVTENLAIHRDPISSAMRFAIAVRSRYAEDEREKAFQTGANQYVILGAGLDTYAYRSKHQHEQVFEVDLPATQSMKTERIQQLHLRPTCDVSYVACDFEKGSLEKNLLAAGFDKRQKSFFSWLGVVPYLDLKAIEETLEFVSTCALGSVLVFDYIVDPGMLNDIEKMVVDILSAQLAAGGEPLKFFFEPQALSKKLIETGFGQVEDISPDHLNKHYALPREDGLRVGNVIHMVKVVV